MTKNAPFPDQTDRSFLLDPFPWYARMRRESPVAIDPGGGSYVAFSFKEAKRVLSDYKVFSSKIPFPPEMEDFTQGPINMDPPRHKSVRSLVQQSFTPKKVDGMEPRITELVHELIDAVEGRNTMEFVAEFAIPLPVIVIAEILGIPVEDRGDFKRWSDGVVLGDLLAMQALAGYFRRLIQERQGEVRGDLISALVAAREADGTVLSEQELVSFCILLLVAGNETTTNLITNAVLSLDEHPEALESLRADRSLVPSAIEETLRHRSPIQKIRRFSTAGTDLGGVEIPAAGHIVEAHIGSANRDGTRFEDPEEFRIDRKPNRHIAFGQGAHFCLGAPLGRLEAKVALETLLERLPNLRVVPGARLEPIPSNVFHGVTALPVSF